MKILVADDDVIIRDLLSLWLKDLGHEVIVAPDGRAAWALANSQPINLLISDWMMPEMDGPSLCHAIRTTAFNRYVYIILCTTRGAKSDLINGMDSGADAFLIKPFDFDQLRVALRACERVLDLEAKLAEQNRLLRQKNQLLLDAHAQIQRDMKAAADLQQSLLPRRATTINGFHFDWLFVPSQILAGDSFDFYSFGTDRVALYQLDVSGHGLQAALSSVALTRMLSPQNLRFLTHRNIQHPDASVDPSNVVSHLNKSFQSNDDTYFTLLFGILDGNSRLLRMTQAGHPSPALITAQGDVTFVGTGGFPVGMIPHMDYETVDIQVTDGTRLFLYSDGVTECQNGNNGERFGQERLAQVLQDRKGRSVQDTLEELNTRLREWQGSEEFKDDVSVLAVEPVR